MHYLKLRQHNNMMYSNCLLSHCCLHSFSFSFFFLSELRLRCGCIRGIAFGLVSALGKVLGGLDSLLFCGFRLNVGSIYSAMLQSVPFGNSVVMWFEGSELATVLRRSSTRWCLVWCGMSSPSS